MLSVHKIILIQLLQGLEEAYDEHTGLVHCLLLLQAGLSQPQVPNSYLFLFFFVSSSFLVPNSYLFLFFFVSSSFLVPQLLPVICRLVRHRNQEIKDALREPTG